MLTHDDSLFTAGMVGWEHRMVGWSVSQVRNLVVQVKEGEKKEKSSTGANRCTVRK